MTAWEIILTVIVAIVCIAFCIQWGVNHIMGALRELAASIHTLNEKADALQEKLDTIESDLELGRIDKNYVNPID